MHKRKLGNSGLEIAPLVFGGNVFGWTADEPTSFKLLDGFVHAGLNCIDTADVYSRWVPGHKGGESETIIGKWMKSRGVRERVIVATKVGMDMGNGNKGLKRDYILRECEASLQRLQTDYIDLYQSHEDDPTTPIDETLSAYQDLIKQGKVRAIGASNYKGSRLQEALRISKESGLPRYESLQPNYNFYDRQDYETELEPICLEQEIGVIPYFSLAKGFLTGKYRSEVDLNKSPRGGGVKGYLNDRGFRILDCLDAVSSKHNARPAQVALAWLMARPSITAPIASATSLDQLQDLIAATRLQLTRDDIRELDQASAY
jgi:aryl-alcohol dehydrogenase-like predicted oxidoreductase